MAVVPEKNFDASLKRLPDRFVSNDVWEIFDRLRQVSLVKDEYETTADFQKRLKEFAQKPIFGELRPGGDMIFEVARGKESMSYDADKALLTVRLSCLTHGVEITRRPVDMSDKSESEGRIPRHF
ncbi:hypothetical protein UNDKW_1643 [Undibacterium sp. KW1]|nr:hypothetical protein UNDKW_1643 [Undibacterium sp. KW1]